MFDWIKNVLNRVWKSDMGTQRRKGEENEKRMMMHLFDSWAVNREGATENDEDNEVESETRSDKQEI